MNSAPDTVETKSRIEAFDPTDTAYIANPEDFYRFVQKEHSVFYSEDLHLWFVTRYADIKAIIKDHERFSSRAIGLIPPPAAIKDRVPEISIDNMIVSLDGDRHAALRNPMARMFGPKVVQHIETYAKAKANELIDSFYDRGSCDIVSEFCYPVALGAMIEVLGIPHENADDYRQWGADLFRILTVRRLDDGSDGPTHVVPEEELLERWGRLAEANAYFRRYVEQRETEPGDDMVSMMIKARDENGDPAYEKAHIIQHISTIIGAGHDTTANQMGSLVLFLCNNPDQLDQVKNDPLLMPRAVEEALRRRPSSMGLLRVTNEEVEIAGTRLPPRSYLYLMIGSSGLDPEQFPNPESFDIQRSNAITHLAFGFGRHACIGAQVARREIATAMNELLRRIPDIRLDPGRPITYRPQLTGLNIEHLHVQWTPR